MAHGMKGPLRSVRAGQRSSVRPPISGTRPKKCLRSRTDASSAGSATDGERMDNRNTRRAWISCACETAESRNDWSMRSANAMGQRSSGHHAAILRSAVPGEVQTFHCTSYRENPKHGEVTRPKKHTEPRTAPDGL